ncbi:ArsA family ATPase [Helicobacter kayseriensis]|uniref:ArsA family ATPase n=1 Tax=Helicobacter kayseriensis TaxID=2905877 RepID=UPI001E4C3D78|nr:TRC40/GET3/ArsA family transport-energizing ATPase [Helicobacter kayseriensis]MCE3048717.1 arsenical pump-driving ATPase GET3 [Helicobacter kayseriensis]
MLLNQIIFIGGKGGVGKSTISSSLALNLSLQNKKTLLISTDPAHNLNDIFSIPYATQISQINPYLSIQQIIPQEEALSYMQEIAQKTKKFLGAHHYELIDRYYKSAAQNGITQESALFDKLVKLITHSQAQWDHIIIDTAPTGHTLRFFTLAQTLKTWSKTMLGYQQKNNHLYHILGSPSYENNSLQQHLEERYQIYQAFQSILTHPQKTSIIFALTPDLLSIHETQRAIEEIQKDKIHIHALAINKILPPSHDPFFKKRYEIQEKYLSQIQQKFSQFPQWFIHHLKEDILEQKHILSLLLPLFRSPNNDKI